LILTFVLYSKCGFSVGIEFWYI